jgi:hypothetical protein
MPLKLNVRQFALFEISHLLSAQEQQLIEDDAMHILTFPVRILRTPPPSTYLPSMVRVENKLPLNDPTHIIGQQVKKGPTGDTCLAIIQVSGYFGARLTSISVEGPPTSP